MTPITASSVWRPSSARRVVLDSFVPVPRGTTAMAPPPLNWPSKDPADTLDYEFDISPALVGNEGDVVSGISVGINPAGAGDLVLSSAVIDGTVVVLWLTAGQSGTVYTVTVAVTTKNGRSIQRSILLPVLSLSDPLVPATALITSSGLLITDQNGNPVVTG